MDTKLLITFTLLNVANVVIQTFKSIITIKCGRLAAAIANAIAFGLYTVVIIYMTAEIDLWLKIIIVALANFVGVFVVKTIEERARKQKLWKVEATVHKDVFEAHYETFRSVSVSHNYIDVDKYVILNFFCENKKQSEEVKAFIKTVGAKYFVSESKEL